VKQLAVLLLLLTVALTPARAALPGAGEPPAAYWRFEDGEPMQKLDAVRGTAEPPISTTADASAHNQPLRTFNTDLRVWPPDTSPTYTADVPGPVVRQTGAPNTRSLSFTPNQDLYTAAPRSGDPPRIDRLPLERFTVEGAFKVDRLATGRDHHYQVVVGKDGTPGDGPNAPFQVVLGGRTDDWTVRNAPAVQIIVPGGGFVSVTSRRPVEAGRWVWFAAVCDGQRLELWIDRGDGGGYTREAAGDAPGGLIRSTGSWTIGRGMHGGGPAMWFDGKIDEVRITPAVLAPEAFLNAGDATAPPTAAAAAPTQPEPLAAADVDPGGPTYANPVLPHLPDPHVIRVVDTYYAYGTSDPGRGYRAYSSPDLVTWTDRGMVFEKTPGSWGREHFWAPCVVEKGGRFYLFYSAVGELPDTGGRQGHRICVATADSPLGPFTDARAPLFGVGQSTIDADVLIDQDGQAYLYYVLDISENHVSEVFAARLADDLLSIRGEPVMCIGPSQDWEGGAWNEGPFVFRDGDTYVMLYSANGFFDPEYAVGYAVAASPMGPWVKSPRNPILSARGPVVGTGHCSVVRSPDGSERFIVYHAHRDGGGVQRRPMYIDRLRVTERPHHRRVLEVAGPTRSPQPAPAGASEGAGSMNAARE